MKQRLLNTVFLLFLPCLVFAQGNSRITSVSGKLNGNQVYAEISLRMPTKEVSTVVSSPIQQDGGFSMEFRQMETSIYKIFLADNNALLIILHPGDQVTLNLDAVNVNNNPQIKGSKETEVFYAFGRQLAVINLGIDSVETAWKANQGKNAPDTLLNILRNRYTFFDDLKKSTIVSFIRSNASSLACLAYIDMLDMDEYFDVYDLFDKTSAPLYPNNLFMQDLHRRVEAARSVTTGQLAPEIALPNPEGVVTSLSSLRGKVVLIDFWASWCGPCRKENPNVVELYKKYNKSGFEIFGVSLDRDGNNWKKAIKDDGLVWTHVSDLLYWQSKAAKTYGVSAIPCTFLLDREGKIIGKKLRGESLTQKLEEIFGY